jgi:hypothetical protein
MISTEKGTDQVTETITVTVVVVVVAGTPCPFAIRR